MNIKKLAEKMNLSVRSDDPRMRRSVLIVHKDGSNMFFRYAFMVRHRNWLIVFTEHQGAHTFAINDLESYLELEKVNEPIEVVDNCGVTLSKLNCSVCNKEIFAKDICSVYDVNNERIDVDVCEDCEDGHF